MLLYDRQDLHSKSCQHITSVGPIIVAPIVVSALHHDKIETIIDEFLTETWPELILEVDCTDLAYHPKFNGYNFDHVDINFSVFNNSAPALPTATAPTGIHTHRHRHRHYSQTPKPQNTKVEFYLMPKKPPESG
jgi:hypothetical protein